MTQMAEHFAAVERRERGVAFDRVGGVAGPDRVADARRPRPRRWPPPHIIHGGRWRSVSPFGVATSSSPFTRMHSGQRGFFELSCSKVLSQWTQRYLVIAR